MITQKPILNRWISLLGLGLIILLAACGSESLEPTPILPPPNVNGGLSENGNGNSDPGANATIASAPGETATAVAETGPVSEATPTLDPTATTTATPAATPATNPPLQRVSSGQMPPSSRDLLFLADGAFKRWQHATSQIETILPGPVPGSRVRNEENAFADFIGDITQFSVSEDGRRAVAVRLTASETVTRTVPETGNLFTDKEQSQELWFLDLVSGESWLILSRVDNLRNIALSPDARHVTFIGSSLDGNHTLGDDGTPIPRLFVLPTGGGNPGPVRAVAECAGFCYELAWHPDNNLITWHDQNAVWLLNLAGREPERLLENRTFNVHVQDPGQAVVYAPIEWASNGRYLLLWKGGWEGGSRAVFDVPTRAVVDIPDTFVYANAFPTEVMWMPDDRLSILRSETNSDMYRPQIELWRFQPEQNAVNLEESTVLSSQNLGAAGQQYLDDGRFAYVLFGEEANMNEAGMYHLTSLTEAPERVNATPPVQFFPGAGRAAWSSDGFAALIFPGGSQGSRVYYGPAGGDFLYDITPSLGAEPHAWHWQPEIIIP